MSFHANRFFEYNGKKIGIKQIKDLKLKGKKFARTKRVKWNNIATMLSLSPHEMLNVSAVF